MSITSAAVPRADASATRQSMAAASLRTGLVSTRWPSALSTKAKMVGFGDDDAYEHADFND